MEGVPLHSAIKYNVGETQLQNRISGDNKRVGATALSRLSPLYLEEIGQHGSACLSEVKDTWWLFSTMRKKLLPFLLHCIEVLQTI